MPRGDGTGPMGQGAMTGRIGGFCFNGRMPYGRGIRQRRMPRRGFAFSNALDSKEQKEILEEQKKFFQGRVEEIEEELENL